MTMEEMEQTLAEERKKNAILEQARHNAEKKLIKINKKLSYTEKLVLRIIRLSYLFVLAGTVFSFIHPDSSVMSDMIRMMETTTIATVGFFIWKARGENLVKITNNPEYDQEQLANELWKDFVDSTTEEQKEN